MHANDNKKWMIIKVRPNKGNQKEAFISLSAE